jgi:hypothetical protein
VKQYFFLCLALITGIEAAAQPGGESCATATVIPSIPFAGSGSTAGATDDHFASCPDVGNQGGGRDHVYQYTTGNNTEYVSFSLCQAVTNYDSQLYIYEGSCSGNTFACREDGCASPAYGAPYNSELLDLALQPNTTYYIVIDGYSAAESGNYQLNVYAGNPPPAPVIQFTDMTHILPRQNFHSGVAIAVSDMNNDGLDDIVRLYMNDTIHIAFQQADGSFTETMYNNPRPAFAPWSICVGDIDSDGYNDLVYGLNGLVQLFKSDQANTFNRTNVNPSYIFSQGSNFVDIDNDGDLDLFICNDVGTSMILLNDGNGNFTVNTSIIDLSTTPSSDNSGNYASIWCDYDDDGDVDLYITKCRQGVTSPTDPRRINQLFRNNGDGTWTEVGIAAGVASGWQGWVSDFGDIDNDGDFDLVIMNHDNEAELMRNNGDGTFTNITNGSGLEGSTLGFAEIQCSFRDFNNDGWVDLLVSGSQHRMFINNGDGTFTLDINSFNYASNWMHSYAIGDFNADGFLDIYGGYGSIYNGFSTRDDKLWMNAGDNGNHYVMFNLQGVQSNRNAVGAKIKLYGPWGVQVREVRSGEGYGIHNSFIQHFGLGPFESFDSVYVYWPSGTIDLLRWTTGDTIITIVEGTQNSIPLLTGHQVKVFPNPTNGSDNIRVVAGVGVKRYSIHDAMGREVAGMAVSQNNGTFEIPVTGLAAGLYHLRLEFSDRTAQSERLVIQP